MGKVTQLVLPRFGEVWQWRIRKFEDHLIFYRIQETKIEVLRVLQGTRDLAEVLRELDNEIWSRISDRILLKNFKDSIAVLFTTL